MSICQLNVESVRNLSQVQMQPCDGFNFIVGLNGAGKSSVLEAIHMLGAGRSFRTSRHRQLIQYEQQQLNIFAEVDRGHQRHRVGMQRDKQSDLAIRINGQSTTRLADLVGLFPLQLLTPESANLLLTGNKVRRQFLDWGLFYQGEQFFNAWKRYTRILKQRNAMVRQQARYEQIGFWDQELISNGRVISQLREEFVARLQQALLPFTHKFLPDHEVTLVYQPGWDLSDDLATQLESNYPRDLRQGYTTLGPHRATFKVKVNNNPAEEMCSRGQLKLLVAALTLAQGALLSQQHGIPCIYLVDDFAAELDESRRALLIECLIAIKSQVFITATDSIFVDQIRQQIEDQARPIKVFHVEQGKLTKHE
ncbi:DNA replication/repair protein RecF [Echinimonas agarilytica]|uniref:DNA replication and repair protein RecF n=1 Tax=Echinimonas agarilytica TaxID=1215918 RepID=A0AA42B5Y1_9GAMM|nr:DNA replication/repair protein RecF [Echinimonas agarilytica]MCM2678084.1 DNA replication/repair protein RecF [Echinimonas agarilytica]